MTLNEYLNQSVNQKKQERVDESLILGAIICSACVAYAVKPVLDTDFMKSVGTGLGGLLGGIGGMFGKLGGLGKGGNKDEIKELLKKDPGDLTQKEKEKINKAANDPKMRKEFTDNELKKISKMNGSSSDDEQEEMSDEDSKELHSILKKKPEDMTPKEKAKLQKFHEKYDLNGELSDKELNTFKSAAGVSITNDEETETAQATPEQISEAMTALAAKANESEKDPEKKKKNAAMIDIITASTYDEDGNPLSMNERLEKMKGLVGKDNWDDFQKDMDEMNKGVDADKMKDELEKVSKGLTQDDVKQLQENQKKRAKSAGKRIAKENKEREDLEKELTELKKDPETNKEKIKELQSKREDLINKSTLGTASPNTAKGAVERAKKADESTPKKETGKEENTDPKPNDNKGNDNKPTKSQAEIDAENKVRGEYETKLKDQEKKQQEEKDNLNKTVDDEKKKGKYTVKDEEITDPDTGKKIKIKTYTGPRGGKFYYPKGSPKKPENKVYVHESKLNINQHLNGNTKSLSGFLKSLF